MRIQASGPASGSRPSDQASADAEAKAQPVAEPSTRQEPSGGQSLYQRDMSQLNERKQAAAVEDEGRTRDSAVRERKPGSTDTPATEGVDASKGTPGGNDRPPAGRRSEIFTDGVPEPGGESRTADGATIRNRSFYVEGTTNEDTKLDLEFEDGPNGLRTTTVRSDQPFEYGPIAVNKGEARYVEPADRQQDGSYRKTFEGNDTVKQIELGGGNDTVTVKSESELLGPGGNTGLVTFLGAGDDNFDASGGKGTSHSISGDAGNDVITTSDGDDTIDGGDGDEIIRTAGGNDLVYGGLGGDTIETGDGDDLIFTGVIQVPSAGITPDSFDPELIDPELSTNLESGQNLLRTRVDTGTNTVFSGAGDDRVYGSLAAQGSDAGSLRHRIKAGHGDDVVETGNGTNVVDAGLGDDFVLGGNGDDTLRGSGGKDTLLGVGGNDDLDGGGGDDVLAGSRGDDTLSGGGGTDKGYDFAGDRNGALAVENAVSVDPTDNLGGFDFTQGRLSENAFRGVESVSAGQELFGSIRRGRETNDQPRTVVVDSGFVPEFGAGAFSIGDNTRTPNSSVRLGPDGLPVPGEGKRSNSIVYVQQDGIRPTFDAPGTANNSVTVAAHESVHVEQLANASFPRLGTSETRNLNPESKIPVGDKGPAVQNAELDAVGLPYDVTGDGVADAESQARFDGRGGESENSILSDLGLPQRETYNGAAPDLDASTPASDTVEA